MDIVAIEIQPRRDPFADAPEIGKLLDEHGYLSVSLVQRKLRMGYTSAARWLDFFVEIGELQLNEETHRYISLRTQLAPDAGDSAASSGIVNASAESTSQTEPTHTQRG